MKIKVNRNEMNVIMNLKKKVKMDKKFLNKKIQIKIKYFLLYLKIYIFN